MKRIVVTGGSGKIGAWILKETLDAGHEVLNVDLKPAADPRCRTLIADLTESGQAFGAIGVYTGIDELQPSLRAQPIDALVHFAAIPRVQLVPDAEVFRINTTSTYNVMEAAVRAGIRKVVFASSEATYGVVFADEQLDPEYFPVDEDHPTVPRDAYGLSKVVNERTAAAFQARVGGDYYGLRIGDVMAPPDYFKFPLWSTDPAIRKREMWAYVDVRDVAQMVRLCVEVDGLGFQVFNTFAGESAHVLPTLELAGRFYPRVPVRAEIAEHESLVSNGKARRLLGFEQRHRWVDQPQSSMDTDGFDQTDRRPLAHLARKKLGEETTRYLRDALLSGQYTSGERMAVHQLAESLGVSTMPVREALVTLANEGLLEVIPRRGFRVATMELRDVEDAFRVHAHVAGLLIEEAAPIIPAATIAELRRIQAAILESFSRPGDEHQLAQRVEELNFKFHRTINHVPDAKRLRWFLRAATRYVPRRFYETIPGWNEATRDRHDAIIDALEARDAGEARRLMEQHVLEAGRLVRQHMDPNRP